RGGTTTTTSSSSTSSSSRVESAFTAFRKLQPGRRGRAGTQAATGSAPAASGVAAGRRRSSISSIIIIIHFASRPCGALPCLALPRLVCPLHRHRPRRTVSVLCSLSPLPWIFSSPRCDLHPDPKLHSFGLQVLQRKEKRSFLGGDFVT
uniref:Uncharacterized protein n=1 Tax=Physcomitrium patens TaxID=3218 RepID=A0A7I4F7S1_PHYPA